MAAKSKAPFGGKKAPPFGKKKKIAAPKMSRAKKSGKSHKSM